MELCGLPVARYRRLLRQEVGAQSIAGALTAGHAWESVRGRFPVLAESPWVLPALRRGPGFASHVGGRLSTQALQVAFAKHAVRTGQHRIGAVGRRHQVTAVRHRDERSVGGVAAQQRHRRALDRLLGRPRPRLE